MKLKNYKIGLLTLPAILLAMSCSDNVNLTQPAGDATDGKKIVTLSVNTGISIGTRATEFPHISDGTKADKLIYSVYEKTTDDKGERSYQLVKDYINEVTGGVNIINNVSFPTTLQFVMDPEDEYTIVLWAQNSQCEAFDTSDLTKVKVDYSKVTNNYELGDAFCNIAVVKGDQPQPQDVLLRRPLAQINVGDAGWDYEGAAIVRPNPRTYAKSSVTIKGVAQYYNVLEARTLTDSDLDSSKGEKAIYEGPITLNMAYMPAFINLETYDNNFDWTSLSYLPYSKQFGPQTKDDDDETLIPVYDSEIEEFLKLNLDENNDEYLKYIGYDSTLSVQDNFNSHNVKDTEHFKYLSMCYVLVPVSKDENGDVKGAVLDEFSFTAAQADGSNPRQLFTLKQLPVQQNWRTNIITDKLFMVDEKFKLFIVPTYAGDFVNESGLNSGDTNDKWNNVEMENSTGVWTVNVENGYGDVNDAFLGYGDQNGEYNDWDAAHDNDKSNKE